MLVLHPGQVHHGEIASLLAFVVAFGFFLSSSYPILCCTSWGQIYTIIDAMCVMVANSTRMNRILQVDTGRGIRVCWEILVSKKQSFGLRSKPL